MRFVSKSALCKLYPPVDPSQPKKKVLPMDPSEFEKIVREQCDKAHSILETE